MEQYYKISNILYIFRDNFKGWNLIGNEMCTFKGSLNVLTNVEYVRLPDGIKYFVLPTQRVYNIIVTLNDLLVVTISRTR